MTEKQKFFNEFWRDKNDDKYLEAIWKWFNKNWKLNTNQRNVKIIIKITKAYNELDEEVKKMELSSQGKSLRDKSKTYYEGQKFILYTLYKNILGLEILKKESRPMDKRVMPNEVVAGGNDGLIDFLQWLNYQNEVKYVDGDWYYVSDKDCNDPICYKDVIISYKPA